MVGDCSDSYVVGNSVHESFARVVVMHAVQYLNVSWNVGYRAAGHNIFLEDGVSTHNIIEYNFIASSLTVSNMLQEKFTKYYYKF